MNEKYTPQKDSDSYVSLAERDHHHPLHNRHDKMNRTKTSHLCFGSDNMIRIKKSDWRAIILLILVFQILALWCIDISISAMLMKSAATEGQVYLTNGFIMQDPSIMYHICLYWLIISSFLLTLITFHLLDGEEEKQQSTSSHPLATKSSFLSCPVLDQKEKQDH